MTSWVLIAAVCSSLTSECLVKVHQDQKGYSSEKDCKTVREIQRKAYKHHLTCVPAVAVSAKKEKKCYQTGYTMDGKATDTCMEITGDLWK